MANTETTSVLSYIEIEKICIELSFSNKINKTNSWGLKLTECLPEIINVDSDTPESDIENTNFQRFSCSLEAASKIYSHRVDSLHDLALYFNKSLTNTDEENENKRINERGLEQEPEEVPAVNHRRIKSKTIEEDETKLNISMNLIKGIYTDPIVIHMNRTLKGYSSVYVSDTISNYYSTYWRGPYSATTDDVIDSEPEPTVHLNTSPPQQQQQQQQHIQILTTNNNSEPRQTIVIDHELANQNEQVDNNNNDDNMIIDNGNDDDDDNGFQPIIQLNLDNYLLLHDDDDNGEEKSISESCVEESISDSKQRGRDRSFQRPSASNESLLFLPDNDGPELDKNEFLTTFLKPRIIVPKYQKSITSTKQQQNRPLVNQTNHHNDDDDDDDDNDEIQVVSSSTNTREDQLTSIRNQLNEITKQHGAMGIEPSTFIPSQIIVDQLNYAKIDKRIDLKQLKKELKLEIESRATSTPIDFQSILTSMGRRLSKELIDKLSISYYFLSILHLCNENNWTLSGDHLSHLGITMNVNMDL